MTASKTIALILFNFLSFNNLFCQKDQFFLDITQAFKEKPKITFRIDSRTSFISNNYATVESYKVGLDFQKKIFVGVSFSRLKTSIYINRDIALNTEKTTINAKLYLNYISIFADYVFFNKNKWEFELPIQLGGGYNYLKYKTNNDKYIFNKKFTIIYETNINGSYKLIKGLGIGAGTGYRIMFLANKDIGKHFTSPIYIFKIKFFPFDFFNPKILKD